MAQRPVFSGPRFRAIREAAGVRMVDLAAAAGVGYSNLRLFEQRAAIRGRPRNLSPETAHRLATALGRLSGHPVHIEDFLLDGDLAA